MFCRLFIFFFNVGDGIMGGEVPNSRFDRKEYFFKKNIFPCFSEPDLAKQDGSVRFLISVLMDTDREGGRDFIHLVGFCLSNNWKLKQKMGAKLRDRLVCLIRTYAKVSILLVVVQYLVGCCTVLENQKTVEEEDDF